MVEIEEWNGSYEWIQQHGRHWGANRAPGCSRKCLEGHKDRGQWLCTVWKNLDFHGSWNSCGCHEHLNRTQPSATGCWSGLDMRMGEDGEKSLLPGVHPPATTTESVPEMTVPELFLRLVKHANYWRAQPLLASLCHAWLAQTAQPCTLLGTHSPMAQPLPTPHTPHPAAMLPFHLPTTVLLSHIIRWATSLKNSSATTEIMWMCWCEKTSVFFPFSYYLKGTALQWKVKLVPYILSLVTLFCPLFAPVYTWINTLWFW